MANDLLNNQPSGRIIDQITERAPDSEAGAAGEGRDTPFAGELSPEEGGRTILATGTKEKKGPKTGKAARGEAAPPPTRRPRSTAAASHAAPTEKETGTVTETTDQGQVLDGQYLPLPVTQVFEHPANRARLYSVSALDELEGRIKEDPRGISRHVLNVTLARDLEGNVLRVKDVVTDEFIMTTMEFGAWLKAHPGMEERLKQDERPAHFVTSGNHRLKVYRRMGMESVPVILQDMDLGEQLVDLVNSNQGRAFSRLEIGRFFLEEQKRLGTARRGRAGASGRSGVTQEEFARRIGKSEGFVSECVRAAEMFETLGWDAQQAIVEYNNQAERFTPDHFRLLREVPKNRRNEFAMNVIRTEMSPSDLNAVIDVRIRRKDPLTVLQGMLGLESAGVGSVSDEGREVATVPAAAPVGTVDPAVLAEGQARRDRELDQRAFEEQAKKTEPVLPPTPAPASAATGQDGVTAPPAADGVASGAGVSPADVVAAATPNEGPAYVALIEHFRSFVDAVGNALNKLKGDLVAEPLRAADRVHWQSVVVALLQERTQEFETLLTMADQLDASTEEPTVTGEGESNGHQPESEPALVG